MTLGPHTTEAEFQAWVDECRRNNDAESLAAILPETTPLFRARGTRQLTRMRGYVLSSFATAGLPASAVAFVLEELENGMMPYTVAAAARALRGAPTRTAEHAPFLLRALRNISLHDDAITFEQYRTTSDDAGTTRGVHEILATIAWMGPAARSIAPDLRRLLEREDAPYDRATREKLAATVECIDVPAPAAKTCCKKSLAVVEQPTSPQRLAEIADVEATDQDGVRVTLGEHWGGHVAIVTFFYTRCENPNKCSRTVSRLAALQERVAGLGLEHVRIAALTYDPAYDTPALMKTYGVHRRFHFAANSRFLRVEGRSALERVRAFFELGVSYAEGIVSQHRIELSVLGTDGRITARFSRLQWDEDQVLAEVGRALSG